MTTNAVKIPICLEIEPTEGCNLCCRFCGIDSLPDGGRERQFLSMELAKRLANQAASFCPSARVEFGGHGEPLLNESCGEIFMVFRAALPATQLQVTTNGLLFLKAWRTWRDRLVDVNVLVIELYEPYGQRLRKIIEGDPGPWRVTDFFRDGFNPWHNHGPKGNVIVLMDDLDERNGQRIQRKIDNRAGNSRIIPSVQRPLQKNCAFPFRRLSVRWDGRVHICCMDWGLEYCVGDVSRQTFKKVWFSPQYGAVRRVLAAKRRPFAPCCFCDYLGGTMKGLLPKLQPPTDEDFEIVKKTNANSPRYNGREARFDERAARGGTKFF